MHTQPKQIICAIDFSPLSDEVLIYAAGLQRCGAELTLLYVETEIERNGKMLQKHLHAFSHYSEILAQSGGLARFSVGYGDPATEILACAERLNADLLVLGSHGSTAFTRLLMGNTAETVMRRACCPVVIYKSPETGCSARERQERAACHLKDNKQTA
ncbi:MAG: universal stress protein [Chlorobium limicola]|uniref:UspA domain protein n=1 Tax=Chlorobium limicola (strain DSM 245 / NBRC 103803 / 6330) TaxID=290315 RepID=B3EDU6_CHLL2|nr:universal stress protein [Chlorobium limicola]ACD89176.1 UspA domain protein [Chlorobium limicola DSM 245]NTV21046.1 universal stress protein [Chlorobium limicola]